MTDKIDNKADIQELILKIKNKREIWQLSPRPKNYKTLSDLGMDEDDIFDKIYENISLSNYSSGPLPDNHISPVKGDIWIFGLVIVGVNCYLKFQDKPTGIIMWISIHEQEHTLDFPYSH